MAKKLSLVVPENLFLVGEEIQSYVKKELGERTVHIELTSQRRPDKYFVVDGDKDDTSAARQGIQAFLDERRINFRIEEHFA